MNTRRRLVVIAAFVASAMACFLLLTVLASAQATAQPPSGFTQKEMDIRPLSGSPSTRSVPVTFPAGKDPVYAESELSVQPYPLRAGEPTEICVEVYNPTSNPQDVQVQFSWANFGIGLPFTAIDGLRPVYLPANSEVTQCIHWVPPFGGDFCLQVEKYAGGRDPDWRSQLNLDVDEPLQPGTPSPRVFPVRNPFDHPVTVTLTLVPHLPDWALELSQDVLPNMAQNEVRYVILTVTPPASLPADGDPIVDVEGHAEGELIGGFRKIYRPPVVTHRPGEPMYAESEISLQPYPPRAGEPTEVCVALYNQSGVTQDAEAQFSVANFGIGLPFTPIDTQSVSLPPLSELKTCVMWVPPSAGQFCARVDLFMEGQTPQWSQLNLDVDEPLQPSTPSPRIFAVRNPLDHTATVTLGLVPHLPDWQLELSQDVLLNMGAGEVRLVTLTVTPPAELPPDGEPIVDVEAYAEGQLIGGFRKIYRAPVAIHQPGEPVYAESELSAQPYPPRAGEPTELCAVLRNPADATQNAQVQFFRASFGIGLPFTPIDGPKSVSLPSHSMIKQCIMWVPPVAGQFCLRVEVSTAGHDPAWSQLNLDVDEPLEPGTPSSLIFPVRNPLSHAVTVTLGLVPHLPDWQFELPQDVLLNMAVDEVRNVTLTTTPVGDLPPDGEPIVDVEAFADGELIGGFRKIYHSPVPIHRRGEPIYAESEIGVDPYPIIAGQPVDLSVEVFNPTDEDRLVAATLGVAPFGIGLLFSDADITPNPVLIFVPRHGAARGHATWNPSGASGEFCVRVTLEMEGYEPVWSQRNIHVGEPLQRSTPHSLIFPVRNPFDHAVTVNLGLIPQRPGWVVGLSQDVLPNMASGEVRQVTLTVTPPGDADLGTGEPIVDVEAFVGGELIGGFRKLDRPPVPLHKLHEKPYAESEISIDPYPPQQGQQTVVSAEVHNTSQAPATVTLEFGWANFGMGFSFTSSGMEPVSHTVVVAAGSTETASVTWTPTQSGHQCVLVELSDAESRYDPQISQRNVIVADQHPCGETKVFDFVVRNNSSETATIDIGTATFDVPADWEVTVEPTSVTLGAWGVTTVAVMVNIPCPSTPQEAVAMQKRALLQSQAGGVPTIDLEGYKGTELVGGIEIRFPLTLKASYVPVVMKKHT
jgi:hypothetical protein